MTTPPHPYREPPPAQTGLAPPAETAHEERALYASLCAIGAIRLVPAVVLGAFGIEPTIASIMLVAGATGLVALRRASRRAQP